MLSGDYLKKPRNPSEDVLGFIEITIKDIESDKWDNVQKDILDLEKAWDKIVPRIQFSVERDEIYNISNNIARLKGTLITKDKSNALIELFEAKENWKELTR
jgi:hypothetical protein